MELLSRVPNLDRDQSAAPPTTLADLRPRLVHFLTPALQRRLHLDAEPLPDPDLDSLTEAAGALRSLYHSLTTYVPRCLAEQVEEHPSPGQARGRFLDGTVLFADISGFTPMSERLGQKGAAGTEELTAIVNRYFGEMLDILARSGGDLLKFAGDAVLVYFPAFTRDTETEADWAIRAGLRMQRAMAPFQAVETSQGMFELRMKVGLASGRFLAAQVGTAERMEFIVTGPAIQGVMAAENVAESGQTVIAPTTCGRASLKAHIMPLCDGFFVLDVEQPFELGDFEIAAVSRRRGAFLPAREAPALLRQMGEELDRLAALAPYLPPELVDKLVAGGKRRRVESEYRATTVLFGHFTGPETYFASLADQENEEENGAQTLATVLDHYFTRVQQIVADHGGIISRIDPYGQGSKLLVLFGAPVAHEDDPQRAIAAALAIREHLPAIDATARSTLTRHPVGPGRDGIPVPADEPIFSHRAGITLGRTFAGEAGSRNRREYTVMGDEVNLAARLMAAARPGQILLSRRVQEHAGPRFLLRALDPIRVKGKSQPIPTYEALGRRRVRPIHRAHPVPLCGRHEEMAVARAALDDAVAGRGHILILAGEAGIGKTRLAAEIGTQAEAQGFLVLWGSALGYPVTQSGRGAGSGGEAPPYDLWREILADLLQVAPGAQMADLDGRLRALGLDDEDPRLALADVLGISPLDSAESALATPGDDGGIFQRAGERLMAAAATSPTTGTTVNLWALASERAQEDSEAGLDALDARVSGLRAQRVRRGLSALLERCASQAPLLLVFENTHWMVDTSWELLTGLAPQLARWPVLALVLVRPGETRVDDRVQTLARETPTRTLHLDNLDLVCTTALARALLDAPDLPDPVAALIYARSQGNPLFVAELVHALQEQSHLAVDPASGRLKVRHDLRAVELPTTVSGVILSRIDRLPPPAQRVLKAAAVIGREFPYAVLQHLLTETLPSTALDEGLASLVRDRFIVELDVFPAACHPVRPGPGVADVVAARTFAFLHGLTQEVAYESLPLAERRLLHRAIGERLEILFAGDLAAHCEELAAHFCHGKVPDKAATYLLMAGDRARDQGAYDEAMNHYRATLDVGDQDPTRAARAHEGMGDVHTLRTEYELAVAAYTRALESHPADAALAARVRDKRDLLGPLIGRADRVGT